MLRKASIVVLLFFLVHFMAFEVTFLQNCVHIFLGEGTSVHTH